MENRWSDRRDLSLEVDMYINDEQKLKCQSRNIGLGGAYLKVASTANVQKDANVRLVFYFSDGVEEIKHALSARVVRIVDGGVGLKFNEFDTGVFRTLQQLMTFKSNNAIH